jgi:hypothetical protein
MPTLWRSLLCRRVITDRTTNTATYIDAVEAFGMLRFPGPFPPVYVVTVWHREGDGDVLQARLRVMSPSGKELFLFSLPEQALTTDLHRHNVGLGGFNLEEAGEHRVVVEQRVGGEWREVRSLPFFVELVEAQAMKPSAEPGAA